MSFQAYLDNIQAKTGKSADDFKQLAERKGFIERGKLKPTVKAGQIVAWLKDEFALGHGHAMAIYAAFKGKQKSAYTGRSIFCDQTGSKTVHALKAIPPAWKIRSGHRERIICTQ